MIFFSFLRLELNLRSEERLKFAIRSLKRGILLSCFLADCNVLEGETFKGFHAFFRLIVKRGKGSQHGFQWRFIFGDSHLAHGSGEQSENSGLRGEGRIVVFHAFIVARPFSRASDKSIFSFLFSGIETSLNKPLPPFPRKPGGIEFWKTARGGFFQSINQFSPFVFISPLFFIYIYSYYISPPISRKRQRLLKSV